MGIYRLGYNSDTVLLVHGDNDALPSVGNLEYNSSIAYGTMSTSMSDATPCMKLEDTGNSKYKCNAIKAPQNGVFTTDFFISVRSTGEDESAIHIGSSYIRLHTSESYFKGFALYIKSPNVVHYTGSNFKTFDLYQYNEYYTCWKKNHTGEVIHFAIVTDAISNKITLYMNGIKEFYIDGAEYWDGSTDWTRKPSVQLDCYARTKYWMSEICIREGDQSNPDGTFTVPTVPYTGRCTRAISYPKPKYPFLSYFNNSSDGVDTPLIGPASSKTTAAYTTTVESTPIGNVPCYTVSSGKVDLYYSNIPRNAEYSADAFIKIASNTYSSGISLLGYAVKFGSMGGYWAITLNAISISDITYYNGTTFNDSIKFSDTNYEYRYRINNLFLGNAWNHVACNMRNVSGNIWDAVLFVNGKVAMSCRMNTPYGGNGVQLMSYGNTVSLQATQHTVHNGIVFPDTGFTVPSSPYAHNHTIHAKLRRLMYNRKKF